MKEMHMNSNLSIIGFMLLTNEFKTYGKLIEKTNGKIIEKANNKNIPGLSLQIAMNLEITNPKNEKITKGDNIFKCSYQVKLYDDVDLVMEIASEYQLVLQSNIEFDESEKDTMENLRNECRMIVELKFINDINAILGSSILKINMPTAIKSVGGSERKIENELEQENK